MTKRKNDWTEKKIEKYIKEGRGEGEFNNYKPWLTIQNISSTGNSSRLKGWKTNRRHELLSDLERNYFFIMEWIEDIIDIREQFPLNREVTYNIAKEKGIRHPICTKNETLIVLTTDFFLTVREGNGIKYLARTIKPSSELENERIIEKFEIEREYWERKGIDWGIVTEKDIPIIITQNISWIHKSYYLDEIEDETFVKVYSSYLMRFQNIDKNLMEICNEFEEQYNLEQGSSIKYFKHLLARKLFFVDMSSQKLNVRSLTLNDVVFSKRGDENCDSIIS
ncbi:TnsA endonuclease N-terminal domain-containing protein [Bacillus paranthracis]|uniref:TnsA endonuclease N-terminal domain-containing protein n=1 Tax=Bacillus paranthracis TaxID=2026186 RepID=UPI00397BE074